MNKKIVELFPFFPLYTYNEVEKSKATCRKKDYILLY